MEAGGISSFTEGSAGAIVAVAFTEQMRVSVMCEWAGSS